MSKSEVFTCKRTNWIGVWRDRSTNMYSSAVFNLSALKEFKGPVRIYMVPNSYKKQQAENAPTHVLKIQGANPEGEVPEVDVYGFHDDKEVRNLIERTIDLCRNLWYFGQNGEDAVTVDDILPLTWVHEKVKEASND